VAQAFQPVRITGAGETPALAPFMIYWRAKGGEMIPRNFFIKAKG
jgi:hypothetical protein